jgi:hypothetical protein
VNHQVEHDVDIQAARSEDAQSMDLKVKRDGDKPLQRHDCRIESLEMAHLENATVLFSKFRQAFARGGRIGYRLFNEHIHARP